METSLKQLIHRAVNQQESKPFKGIHASSLGGCPRVHYWKIKGLKETTPPETGALMNFKMGDVWEETIFPMIDGLDGVKVHHHKGETWSDKELNLYGTPDFTVEMDGKKVIVDAKTVNSKWFNYTESRYKKVERTGISRNDFLLAENHHYAIQQGCYLLLAKRMGLKYDHARLLFVNKDNSFVGWEVEIYLTEELEKEILDRIKYLNACLEMDKLPRCECEGWKVGYCDFGVVETRETNSTKKVVNTSCCDPAYVENYNKILKGES